MAKLDDQDIMFNIIVRLPVKSILRFRCVSKAWCKLLKDPEFVKKHLSRAIEMNKFSVMMLSFYGPYYYDEDTDTYTFSYDPSSSTLSNPVHINYPSRYKDRGTSINLKVHPKRDSYYVTTFVYLESLVMLNSGTYVADPDIERKRLQRLASARTVDLHGISSSAHVGGEGADSKGDDDSEDEEEGKEEEILMELRKQVPKRVLKYWILKEENLIWKQEDLIWIQKNSIWKQENSTFKFVHKKIGI
ncbi:hypothetical protein MKX03_017187 [Papaver bracteatum]|nr:hypothetical protein MKX03_017187 [Papaver bracteatum]